MTSALGAPPAVSEPAPVPRPGPAGSRSPLVAPLLALVLACGTGLALALWAHVIGIRAVPGVLRTSAAGLVLFGVCGYAPARWLARDRLLAHRALLVLPLGAALSSLAVAVLGLLHVPLTVSLITVLLVSAIAAVMSVRSSRTPSPSERPPVARVGLVLALAGMVGLISLLPIFRAGHELVPGQNGDAILVVGSATLLQHAPPTATRLDQPINHIPLQWRSKYPIYYALAAVSKLAGQDPIQAFAALSALILALTAVGFFLFARCALRAPPWGAWLALFVVPLDRIVMYVTIHPYYNELWGQFTLPFILLAGWRYVRAPTRSGALLLVVFLILGLLAYPLMLPFPVTFLLGLGVATYIERRREGRSPGWLAGLRLPRLTRLWMWAPVVVIAVPVVAVLGRGFLEKTSEAAAVLLPGSNLSGWQGNALPFLPVPRFFGMPEAAWGWIPLVAVWLLAARRLWRTPRAVAWGLGVMIACTGAIAIYFRSRTGGELFFFKDLAFLGPYVVLLALLELAALARRPPGPVRLAAAGALALASVLVVLSAGHEINQTFEQSNLSIIGLRGWDRALPAGTSVLIDVPPTGYQLWVTYMFKDHPLSAVDPLTEFFPHPPQGRKADYVIAEYDVPPPRWRTGPPLFRNAQFTLWRMSPATPGVDVSSRRLIDQIPNVTFGAG